MKRLIVFVEQNATTPKMLFMLGIVLIVNALLFPNLLPPDFIPLDLQFSYTPAEAYAIIDAYGAETIRRYRWVELTVDIIYPIVYALLFSTIIYKLHGAKKIVILPFLIALVDFLENIGIVSMLGKYPEQFGVLAEATSFLSSVKWTLLVALIGLVLHGLTRKYLLKSN